MTNKEVGWCCTESSLVCMVIMNSSRMLHALIRESASASKKRKANEYSAIATTDNNSADNAKPSTVTSGIGIKQEQENTDDENDMKKLLRRL